MNDPNKLDKPVEISISLLEGGRSLFEIAGVTLNSNSTPPIINSKATLSTYKEVSTVLKYVNNGDISISKSDEDKLKSLLRKISGISDEENNKAKAAKLSKFIIKLPDDRVLWASTDGKLFMSRQANVVSLELERDALTARQRREIVNSLNAGILELAEEYENAKLEDKEDIDLNEEYDEHLHSNEGIYRLLLDMDFDSFSKTIADAKEPELKRLMRIEKETNNRKEYISILADTLGSV